MIVQLLAASFISVQVGSFTDEARAVSKVEELRRDGFDAYFLRFPSVEGGESTYKVRAGSFADNAAARAAAEKLKAKGHDGAFATATDLQETIGLSSDLTILVGALESVNPGRVPREGSAGKRLHVYAQDYVTLFLLAAQGTHDPGKKLTDLAVWDTNPDNQPEIFVVLDEREAYALYWVKSQSRYELQSLLADAQRGSKISIGEAFDLSPGPEKFIALRYERGGDLYKESGYLFRRWDQKAGDFAAIGRLPLEVVDKAEESDGAGGIVRTRSVEPKNVDADRDRELWVVDAVQSGGATREHADVWDWDGKRLDQVVRPKWFEEILATDGDNELAAQGLFGLGIEKALDDRLDEAQAIFQTLVSGHPEFDVSKRAVAVIKETGERKKSAETLNRMGYEELEAGAPELALQDLRQATILDPGSAKAHYNLAVARLANGDRLGALRALRRAVELDADDKHGIKDKASNDGDLAALRAAPEFKEILRR